MADDKPNTEAETTEARKRVFIIKAKYNGLKSAENFLKNRSWELVSAFDMKIALATLFRQKMDYALIGVDHSHPHVLKLPDIVAQTIKIPVILFAESMTPQAAHMLRSSKHPYVLFPPVSGPAIERMLLKIEKDRQQAAQQRPPDSRTGEATGSDSMSIRISDGGGAFENAQMNGSFSEEDIAKLFEGEGLSPMMNATESGPSANAFTQYQKGASAHTLGETEDGQESYAMTAVQAGPDSSKEGALPSADGSQPAEGAGPRPSFLPSSSSIDLSLWPQSGRSPGGNASRKEPGHHEFSPIVEDLGGYDRQVRNQSVLMNGTEHALSKSSVADPAIEVPVNIGKSMSSKVACFAIKSSGVSGAIVCAYGNDRPLDEKFANDLRDHLILYMQENGIEFKIDDVMNLTIQQVEFEEWSEKEAVFLRKSIHAGCELALGFFINATPYGNLEPSPDDTMLKVHIDEIRTDLSLEFDIFLYFPENGKYIRYVGKNGNLSNKQWDRLTANGITELHVKKEAEGEISRYRMTNFLNDKIADFQQSKKAA